MEKALNVMPGPLGDWRDAYCGGFRSVESRGDGKTGDEVGDENDKDEKRGWGIGGFR